MIPLPSGHVIGIDMTAALRLAAWLGWAAGVPVGAAAVLSAIHRGAPD